MRGETTPTSCDLADPAAEAGSGVDELGAHVSAAGGVDRAPARARELASVTLQLFTKQPSRWAEPTLADETIAAFHRERHRCGIRTVAVHDSYLINLASPNPGLWGRSLASFTAELERCARLGVDLLVTHPGNATDGDLGRGIARNAEAVGRAIADVPGTTRVLLELTAGSGSSVGGTFAHLSALLDAIPASEAARVGVCFDTCHAWAAGWDLVGDYDGVIAALDEALGLARVGLFHLNDAASERGSHRDRHAGIGDGALGVEPFRRLLRDPRFATVPKVIETPKGEDPPAGDRRNLELLRSLRF